MTESLFFKRHSLRAYCDKDIPDDVLDRIIEKTRWSPSCNNNQPWRFIFVRDRDQHAKFVDCLPRGNKWAAKAPVLIAVCARQSDDAVRDDDPVMYYQFGCGLAVMALLLAAVDDGLMAHPMAGYDAHKLHATLEIPAEFHIMCIIALGYEGPIDLLDEVTRKKDESPRTRKPVHQIMCWDKFGF